MAVTADVVEEFIRSQFLLRRNQTKPLIVGLQGPQGSGKSYLSSLLETALATGPSPLRTVILSIDDLYLPHDGLVNLANCHPHNPLLQGRGQPGTHDVVLGVTVLSSLCSGKAEVCLPRFDKSRFEGEGDRLPVEESLAIVQPPPVDVVIMEGWCVGFRSISSPDIEEKWKVWEEERVKLQIPASQCTKADIAEVNELLRDYDLLWDTFDNFVQLGLPAPLNESSSRYQVIYRWRLEQERSMKASNGGKGMSDDAVKRFVDRYIPGYVFFGRTLQYEEVILGRPSHASLLLTLSEGRQLAQVVQK